jgi:hypothetical protein
VNPSREAGVDVVSEWLERWFYLPNLLLVLPPYSTVRLSSVELSLPSTSEQESMLPLLAGGHQVLPLKLREHL